jgi:hypothetical protein
MLQTQTKPTNKDKPLDSPNMMTLNVESATELLNQFWLEAEQIKDSTTPKHEEQPKSTAQRRVLYSQD